ncbi:unnamed protein product [Phytophthora fragariaefolia]|uniref:Unnamed protein product n=1 Tax=Phytophthora fragariaefolia TaxID=1490495 RepID=A0A9W7CTT1_9STRA|nr:unnamed protein product [Phytophthora fragariaefolia]
MTACQYSRMVEKEERETEEGGSHDPVTGQPVPEEGGHRDAVPERLTSEEGGDGVAVEEQLISEEGEATPDATMPTTVATPVAMKVSGRAVPGRSIEAQVRLARKAKERDAKKQRVECVVQRRTASQHGGDEIELAVAQMYGECCERRQLQADEARNELKEIL